MLVTAFRISSRIKHISLIFYSLKIYVLDLSGSSPEYFLQNRSISDFTCPNTANKCDILVMLLMPVADFLI